MYDDEIKDATRDYLSLNKNEEYVAYTVPSITPEQLAHNKLESILNNLENSRLVYWIARDSYKVQVKGSIPLSATDENQNTTQNEQ